MILGVDCSALFQPALRDDRVQLVVSVLDDFHVGSNFSPSSKTERVDSSSLGDFPVVPNLFQLELDFVGDLLVVRHEGDIAKVASNDCLNHFHEGVGFATSGAGYQFETAL